jgi:hypothetical protein
MEQNLKLKIMLKTTDKIAVWMESNLDDDYGKMGISALRYLNNEIVCVVDSVFCRQKAFRSFNYTKRHSNNRKYR